ncbi:hypothetical protein C7271_10075 [filamentous cyanobacterium CCP5]|nr:hypothetical protein C7271_10075 [filamentous cyanobacterium CCP5]
MAAALKSSVPAPSQPRRQPAQAKSSSRVAAAPPQPGPVAPGQAAQPDSLVQLKPPSPVGRLLSLGHQASSVVTAIAVVMALGGYGYSVHISRQLSHGENRLAQLQRSEDQLTTVNEVLKNHMAEQVEQTNTDLRPPRLGNVLFLRPAPLPESTLVPDRQILRLPQQPLSY